MVSVSVNKSLLRSMSPSKYIMCMLVLLLSSLVCKSQHVEVMDDTTKVYYTKVGVASYYGESFHGRKTASGEKYNKNKLTAAHPSLPFGTLVKVTNVRTGKWVIVRINDRGPYVGNRVIDVSYRAARHLGMLNGKGIVRVRIEELPSRIPATQEDATIIKPTDEQ
jgi:rare lipoprotein A